MNTKTMTIPRVRCKNCGYTWIPRSLKPAWCPRCHFYGTTEFYSTEKVELVEKVKKPDAIPTTNVESHQVPRNHNVGSKVEPEVKRRRNSG